MYRQMGFCRLASVSVLLLAAATASQAQSVVYSGRLDDPSNVALVGSNLGAPSFVDAAAVANNVALYTLNVPIAGVVTIQSTGFAAGGIDPYFSLFSGAGGAATFVDSNYFQAFSTGGDFSYSAVLTAGVYRIAVGVFANMSFAENLGVGTLDDGFTGLGTVASLGATLDSYRLLVTSPAPEPASAWMLALGLCALFLANRSGGRR